MALYVGIDVSKEKFDACGISDDGKKAFSVTCPMNRAGFEDLVLHVPKEASPLLGMESTASYHIALFSYLTAQGYRVALINPLLIANFTKLSLRKTKTDKKAASTIAEFLLLKKDALAMETEPPRLSELKDLSRRRERLADQVTALKNDMLRILSVTFPELESIMGVAYRSGAVRIRLSPREPALRKARVCYDHLAGELGVLVFDGLQRRRLLRFVGGEVELTKQGKRFWWDIGVNTEVLAQGRRALCRACLDWSARRHHLAGALGAALLNRCFEQGWARRAKGSRVVSFTPAGERSLREQFSLPEV